MTEFRPYQAEGVVPLRAALRAGTRITLFEASVGYGKSAVMEVIAHAYADAGKHVLIVSNRTAVVDQLRARARGHERILVGTIQGVSRRVDRIPAPSLIMIDEIHMFAKGKQWRAIIDAFPAARVILFTGTPTQKCLDASGAHVKGRDADWLTENDYLAPLRYVVLDTIDFRKIDTRRNIDGDLEFDPEQLVEALEAKGIAGDAIGSYSRYCKGRPTVAFTVNVKHARAVAAEFQAADFTCEVLIGEDSKEEVARKIEFLKSGGLVISVKKISAGFDLPSLFAILDLEPTLSPHNHIQKLGRPARTDDDKPFGIVFDHAGNVWRHGTLTAERDWRDGGGIPREAQASDGSDLRVRRCGECYFLFEASVGACCPSCGHDNGKDLRISRDEAARLAEMEAAEIEEARRLAGLVARDEQWQAKTLEDLIKLGKVRKHKNPFVWARKIIADREEKAAAALCARLERETAETPELPIDLPPKTDRKSGQNKPAAFVMPHITSPAPRVPLRLRQHGNTS